MNLTAESGALNDSTSYTINYTTVNPMETNAGFYVTIPTRLNVSSTVDNCSVNANGNIATNPVCTF